MAVFDLIEGWYNPSHRHSALDYRSPIDYERIHQQKTVTTNPYTIHRNGITPVPPTSFVL
jgi:hypothetical protein